jgi:hypothetical protein
MMPSNVAGGFWLQLPAEMPSKYNFERSTIIKLECTCTKNMPNNGYHYQVTASLAGNWLLQKCSIGSVILLALYSLKIGLVEHIARQKHSVCFSRTLRIRLSGIVCGCPAPIVVLA